MQVTYGMEFWITAKNFFNCTSATLWPHKEQMGVPLKLLANLSTGAELP